MDEIQLSQGYRATTGEQFSLYHKFREILGTHLIDLGKMKDGDDHGATQWF